MPKTTIMEPPNVGDEIRINVDLIPDYMRDKLAAATLDLLHDILRQPGGREALDAETARRHAAMAAAK